MNDPALLNDRYHLKRILGAGGMAVVYEAEDRMLERTVAIKVLREKYSSDVAFRERFRQEAKAAANLSHPNIVTVHDFGYDDKRLFIVMEFVPGETLKTLIERRSPFLLSEAIPLITQVCAGVGYAHRAGLIHCDMKPHNVVVMPDGRIKVADFGIARALSSVNPNERTEIVWGSPQYFSPEQARGLAPSPASDVYGIGVILFQMLTGQLPFQARNNVELAKMHRVAVPPSPRELNPTIPRAINDILLKVLSKEPSARYRTADQLGRVLQSFTQSSRPASQSRSVVAKQTILPVSGPSDASVRSRRAPVSASSPREMEGRAREIFIHTSPEEEGIDWINVFLGLLAIVSVGGLIPFWIWVYYVINNPG